MNNFDYIYNTFIKNNLKIFPVMENKKTPLIEAWQKDCSSDIHQIIYWLENAKGCNIGLPANENNLFIIDIDMHGDVNGRESFLRLLNDIGIEEFEDDITMQSTPSGGTHFIFRSDEELKKVTNSSNCFDGYPGIDIRTNGYILVEPSTIDGKKYQLPVISGLTKISKMPDKLREFILNNNKEIEEKKSKDYEKPKQVDKGSRDTSLFEYLNDLYFHTRLDKEEITLLAHYFNSVICNPPLPDSTVEYKINKLFKKKRFKIIIIGVNDEEDMEESIEENS